MCIEINTSGLHKAIGEPYPSLDLARMVVNAEIPFTTGSDAHLPERVGFRFDWVSDFLNTHQRAKIARFRNRRFEALDVDPIV